MRLTLSGLSFVHRFLPHPHVHSPRSSRPGHWKGLLLPPAQGPARVLPKMTRCALCVGEGCSGQKRWREEVPRVLGAAGGSWSLGSGWEGAAVLVVQGQDWRPTASCPDPWLGERLITPSEPEPLHLTAGAFDAGPISAPPRGEAPPAPGCLGDPCPASLSAAAALSSGLLFSAPLFPAPPSASPGTSVCHRSSSDSELAATSDLGAQRNTSESSAGTQGLLTQQALSTSGHHQASPSLLACFLSGVCRIWPQDVGWGCCGEEGEA